LGYTDESAEGKILAIFKKDSRVKEAKEGDVVQIVADRTPFYGEAGGQAGDIGLAVKEGVEIEIKDTKRPVPEIIVHNGVVKKGTVREGDTLTFAIDSDRRQDIRCNHTATHLLHKALREVLGEHVKQAGSLVEPERLRFDFSHFQAMTAEELSLVESLVNESVRRNYPVVTSELTYDEAVSRGALAFFGEKYGEKVRMIDVTGFSRELCGGTHVKATGEIGMLKIISESSVAAGVRRIEAVTGTGAQRYVENLEREQEEIAKTLKVQPSEIKERISKLLAELKKYQQESEDLKTKIQARKASDFKPRIVGQRKTTALVEKIEGINQQALLATADMLRTQYKKNYVLILFTVHEGTVRIVISVSPDLFAEKPAHLDAGQLMKEIAPIVGGKGGGRPDLAQGGGPDMGSVDKAMDEANKLVDRHFSS
jgi:alanyl-tRNA synthetase